MKKIIFIASKFFDSEEKLSYYIELGIEHAQSKTNL
jgi:hypothetical protein